MGQYYIVANMDKEEYMESHNFVKLMEWSYNRNPLILTMEELMAKEWRGDRVYVIGDYADGEQDLSNVEVIRELEKEVNLQDSQENSLYMYIYNRFNKREYDDEIVNDYRYIYNHNTKEYIDMEHCPLVKDMGAFEDHGKWYHATIAPLSLMISLGNGLGGGDYWGNNSQFVGSWAKDTASLEITEKHIYPEYKEFVPDFYEGEYISYKEKSKLIDKVKKKQKRAKEGRDRWEEFYG